MNMQLQQAVKGKFFSVHGSYHGPHEDGRHRIIDRDVCALISGPYFVIVPPTCEWSEKMQLVVNAAIDAKEMPIGETLFIANHPHSKMVLGISGTIDYCGANNPDDTGTVSANATQTTASAMNTADEAVLIGELMPPKVLVETVTPPTAQANANAAQVQSTSIAKLTQNYFDELKQVAAELAGGFDPKVRLAFVVRFSGRSRASIYRDCGISLPHPMKVGRASVWKFVDVQVYAAGQKRVVTK